MIGPIEQAIAALIVEIDAFDRHALCHFADALHELRARLVIKTGNLVFPSEEE
jgi:hypothetical protein